MSKRERGWRCLASSDEADLVVLYAKEDNTAILLKAPASLAAGVFIYELKELGTEGAEWLPSTDGRMWLYLGMCRAYSVLVFNMLDEAGPRSNRLTLQTGQVMPSSHVPATLLTDRTSLFRHQRYAVPA